jgi:hypothetical protein
MMQSATVIICALFALSDAAAEPFNAKVIGVALPQLSSSSSFPTLK